MFLQLDCIPRAEAYLRFVMYFLQNKALESFSDNTYDIHFILGLSSRKYAVKNIQRGFNYFLRL